MFFDTAVNGYYTLTILKKELQNFTPLIASQENISDDAMPFIFETEYEKAASVLSTKNTSFKEIVFFESKETINILQNYFSSFVVQTIKEKQFYFRFWAANVFRNYISACNAKQLTEFFRLTKRFICEDDDAAFTNTYSFDGKQLITEKMPTNLIAAISTQTTDADLTAAADSKNEPAKDNIQQPQKKPSRKFFID